MVGAMLSNSLIMFSADGWGCVPSLFFDLRPNYGGGNEDNGDCLHKILCITAALNAPTLPADHCWPTLPLETPGHSQAILGQSPGSLLLFLLGPGAHKVLFVPSKCLFPQFCVSSGGSMVGLMATSSKRAYATSRLLHPDPLPLQPATAVHRRHSNTQRQVWLSLSGSVWIYAHYFQ